MSGGGGMLAEACGLLESGFADVVLVVESLMHGSNRSIFSCRYVDVGVCFLGSCVGCLLNVYRSTV